MRVDSWNSSIFFMENVKIKLELSVKDVNLIIAGLSKLPLEVSFDLVVALKKESEAQLEEATKLKPVVAE